MAESDNIRQSVEIALRAMRAAQVRYFKSRSADALQNAQHAESVVDRLLIVAHSLHGGSDPLFALASRVRQAQIKYFRTRHHKAMLEATELESELDAMLARPEPKQEELF